MSIGRAVASDHQLARLLQIGVVLEEVVEARASRNAGSIDDANGDNAVRSLLTDAAAESARHRDRLEGLIEDLDAESVAYEEIEALVEANHSPPEDFDDVLYDQLWGEETAYKFYDDLIEAIEASDAHFTVDHDRLLTALREIRADEEAGVEEVTERMERRT